MKPHTCHAPGCPNKVPARMFSCHRHWAMIPNWLQRALWSVYRTGQEIDKRPSRRYVVVQTRCRLEIAEREGLIFDVPKLRAQLAGYVRTAAAPPVADGATDAEVLEAFDTVLRERHQ